MVTLQAAARVAFAENLQTLEEIGLFQRNSKKPKPPEDTTTPDTPPVDPVVDPPVPVDPGNTGTPVVAA